MGVRAAKEQGLSPALVPNASHWEPAMCQGVQHGAGVLTPSQHPRRTPRCFSKLHSLSRQHILQGGCLLLQQVCSTVLWWDPLCLQQDPEL